MTQLITFTVDELAVKCQQKIDQACWELFRRAFSLDDQAAWQALIAQYRRLIGVWGRGTNFELDDLVNETFARFWQGIHQKDFERHFSEIGAVMRYLKRCAKTLVIDEVRRRERRDVLQEELQSDLTTRSAGADSLEEIVLSDIFSEEQRTYIEGRLSDEDERLIYRLSYEYGLKPGQIVAQYSDRFPEAGAVYRIKERIVRRLADDPVLRKRWLDA